MENINEKENLVNSIDDKIHKLSSLKCDYWNNNEIAQFSIINLEDKVKELSSIMDKYAEQCGIVISCAATIIGLAIFGISFIVSRNVILSLSISIISLCSIWICMKKHNRKCYETKGLKCDIEYNELTEVNTVKKNYEFWDSVVPKSVEIINDAKVNKLYILVEPFMNMLISASNYATFKTRYYDNVFRIHDFYTKVFDDIWLRNKNVYAKEFVEYFVKNTSAWSCRKETYQMIMLNCTELTFMHLILSIEGYDLSKYKDEDIDNNVCVDEFMRCIKENDKIDELTKIDKFLTLAIDIDNYCQKKLDDIDLLTRA